MQIYSDPSRETDPHALPDIEVFQLTSEEAAGLDEDAAYEASKEFPLMHVNSRDHSRAVEWIIEEYGDNAGWYWWSCFPGCLPDSAPLGPFETQQEAVDDSQA